MWERVTEPDDPRRCQSNRGGTSQCINVAVDGSKYCPAHGGNRAASARKEDELKLYHGSKFLARAEEVRKNGAILSLTMELAYLKEILQQKLLLIKDEHSFVIHQAGATDLIMKIDRLVHSCVKLQDKLGSTLTADQALQFAEQLTQIVCAELEGEALERVKAKIADCLQEW